jgi:amylosucrase
VLNHTAREHAWGARGGDADRQRTRAPTSKTAGDPIRLRSFADVFPDTAPGSFTWEPELGRWVWTTFNAYQWDLDYANPDVFVAMAETMLALAATGVDVLRLDAAPFMWKRAGTNCQNQPEVHALLRAFRALMRIAAPAVAFKAEAIVAPKDLVPYLDECDLAYHNVLMVLLWSALASGRVGAAHPHAAGDAARAAGRGLGDLRALPRRHRLGHHRGGRRRGRRGRPPAPALPGRLLRGRLPRQLRARRALPARAADG